MLQVSNQGTSNGDDMTARFPANLFRQNPTYVDEPADYRTFFFPKAVLKAQVYATSTKYTISTSTITSTSVISCIQAASFFGGSSQSCRRRRDNKEILAQFEEEDADGSLIEPSPIHRFTWLLQFLWWLRSDENFACFPVWSPQSVLTSQARGHLALNRRFLRSVMTTAPFLPGFLICWPVKTN